MAIVTRMRHAVPHPVAPAFALAGLGAIVPGATILFVGGSSVHLGGPLHFVGVGVSAAIANAGATG